MMRPSWCHAAFFHNGIRQHSYPLDLDFHRINMSDLPDPRRQPGARSGRPPLDEQSVILTQPNMPGQPIADEARFEADSAGWEGGADVQAKDHPDRPGEMHGMRAVRFRLC
jgi:hypothetical protein